jgi:8-oxo-dGTP diphosphatase
MTIDAEGTVIATGHAPWIPAAHRMDLIRIGRPPAKRELITAAFALVFDPYNRLLLTHVNLPGRGWDVPGGHIDVGESPSSAAAREVAEETGFEVAPSALVLVGCQRFTLLELPPDWYPYPYPLSYTLMFATRTSQNGPPVHPPAGSECGPAEWCVVERVTTRCAQASWLPFVASVVDDVSALLVQQLEDSQPLFGRDEGDDRVPLHRGIPKGRRDSARRVPPHE